MVYARMLLPSAPREEVYLGIMRLESNRSVELLVRSYGLGGFHGENVFKAVAKSIQYHPGQELADGRVLIEEFLSTQSGGGYPRLDPEEAFLIKDAAGKNLGYYHARHSMPNDPQQIRSTQIQQFEYNFQKLKSQLWVNPLDKNYRWKTDVKNFRTQGTQAYEIAPDENGVLGVTHNAKEVRTFPAGQFFLPEPLLVQLAHVFLQSDRSGVIVDVLNAKGQLVPVHLTKIQPASAKAKSDSAESVVRMDFLYHPDSYEELLFDGSQNILGKFEQQPGHRPRIWDAVSPEALQQIFQEEFKTPGDKVAWNR